MSVPIAVSRALYKGLLSATRWAMENSAAGRWNNESTSKVVEGVASLSNVATLVHAEAEALATRITDALAGHQHAVQTKPRNPCYFDEIEGGRVLFKNSVCGTYGGTTTVSDTF